MELPYGRNARVWVNSEVASYRIMSVSAEYGALWIPFFHMVNFAGHVVNVLINYTGKFNVVKFILRVSNLSKFPPEECFKLWSEHRKFIQGLLKDQNLQKYIRLAYLAVAGNHRTWSFSWEETFQEGLSKSESVGKLEEVLGSMPDVSDPSSDDFAFIETKSRSTSPTLKSRNFEKLASIKFAVAAVPVQLESFQWIEKQPQGATVYKCPQCSMTFTASLSFEVHLRAHLPANLSSIKFDSSYDERVDAFLKTLNRFATERKTALDALHFEKRFALPSGPSAPLKPIALLSGEKTTINTDAPLSKNTKKKQKQIAEKLNELTLKSNSTSPFLKAVEAVSSNASTSASTTASKSDNVSPIALANAHVSSSAKANTTSTSNANVSFKSASPVKVAAPANTASSANVSTPTGSIKEAQPMEASVPSVAAHLSNAATSSMNASITETPKSSSPTATSPAASAVVNSKPSSPIKTPAVVREAGPKSPSVDSTPFSTSALNLNTSLSASNSTSSPTASTSPSRPNSPTITKINLLVEAAKKLSPSPDDEINLESNSSPNKSIKKPKMDSSQSQAQAQPQASKLPSLPEAINSSASSSSQQSKRSHSNNNLTIDLTADGEDAVKVKTIVPGCKSINYGSSAFAQGPVISSTPSPVKSANFSASHRSPPGPIRFVPYLPSKTVVSTGSCSSTNAQPILPPSSELLQERPNDSYVHNLRQFLSKSSDNTPTMSSSVPLGSSASAAAMCWNCFKKLPVDAGNGEAIYPCPLCKVKEPIL